MRKKQWFSKDGVETSSLSWECGRHADAQLPADESDTESLEAGPALCIPKSSPRSGPVQQGKAEQLHQDIKHITHTTDAK